MTTFTPEEVERKTTQSTNKPYVRVRIPGQGWVSCWETEGGNLLLSNPTATFTGEIVQKGDFKNLEQVALAGPGEASGASENGSQAERMTKSEWDDKENRDALRRLYISHLDNITDLAMHGTVSLSASGAADVGFAAYDQMQTRARMYANQDLLWIRKGGTDEPF